MKKLGNKGFTVIEILVSFVLVMIIIVNLFTIVMSYRNKSQIEILKADYLTFKSTVTKDIQTDILKKGLSSANYVSPGSLCGADITQCVQLNFKDGTAKRLFVYYKQTPAAVRNKYLQYGDQKYKIRDDIPDDKNIPAGKTAVDYQTVDIYTGQLLETFQANGYTVYGIHISLRHNDLPNDYGIHIVAIPGYKDTSAS